MVYVAADLSFKKDEARDREIIENWNRYIQDEDFVLLFGEITVSKEATSIKKIFDNLKGQKRVMDMNYRNRNEVERFKFITGTFPYCMSCFVKGEIQGKEQKVVLPATSKELEIIRNKNGYCAGANSLLGQTEIFQNNCLDISIDKWGYIPIVYTDIPNLINNILLYE